MRPEDFENKLVALVYGQYTPPPRPASIDEINRQLNAIRGEDLEVWQDRLGVINVEIAGVFTATELRRIADIVEPPNE